MSQTLSQIFATNPASTILNNDLFYLVQSPYTPGTDAAITGASLKSLFLLSANNLSDVPNPTAARSNLGLTALATAAPPLSGTLGGTGVNNGASTITIGGSVTFSGAFTFTGTLTGNTSVTFPTSGTLATTSQLLVSPLTTKGDIWVWSTTNDRLPVGATNGQVLQANSVAATGLSWSTATFPSTATNAARILRSDGTNWVETTSTFADTYAASSVLYANGANNVAGLATANNGLLVTSNTGVPSILAGPGATGRILQSNTAAAPSFSTATFPSVGGTSGNVLISDGTNYIASTSLWPNTVGTSGKVVISNGTSNVYSTPTFPNASATTGKFIISDGTNWIASTSTVPNTAGTAGKVLISDGTNFVSSTPTFPNASATTRKMIVSDGTNWVASTETWAIPGTSGNVLTSDGTNWTSASASGSLPTGAMFNLQSTTLTTTFTVTGSTYVAVTGLTATITPTSASNKILVRAVVQVGCPTTTDNAICQLVRGSTAIGVGTSPGSRTACSGFQGLASAATMESVVMEFLDSPATTSATTYGVQMLANGGNNVYVNRTATDTNSVAFPRTASTITVCEVKV